MATENNCSNCSMRAKYELKPKSFIGRFWRWHINFCPGWKQYMASLEESDRQGVKLKYNIK